MRAHFLPPERRFWSDPVRLGGGVRSRAEARGDILTSQRTVNFAGWPHRYGAELPAWVAVSRPACNVAPATRLPWLPATHTLIFGSQECFLSALLDKVEMRKGDKQRQDACFWPRRGLPDTAPASPAPAAPIAVFLSTSSTGARRVFVRGKNKQMGRKYWKGIFVARKFLRWWIKLINDHV